MENTPTKVTKVSLRTVKWWQRIGGRRGFSWENKQKESPTRSHPQFSSHARTPLEQSNGQYASYRFIPTISAVGWSCNVESAFLFPDPKWLTPGKVGETPLIQNKLPLMGPTPPSPSLKIHGDFIFEFTRRREREMICWAFMINSNKGETKALAFQSLSRTTVNMNSWRRESVCLCVVKLFAFSWRSDPDRRRRGSRRRKASQSVSGFGEFWVQLVWLQNIRCSFLVHVSFRIWFDWSKRGFLLPSVRVFSSRTAVFRSRSRDFHAFLALVFALRFSICFISVRNLIRFTREANSLFLSLSDPVNLFTFCLSSLNPSLKSILVRSIDRSEEISRSTVSSNISGD